MHKEHLANGCTLIHSLRYGHDSYIRLEDPKGHELLHLMFNPDQYLLAEYNLRGLRQFVELFAEPRALPQIVRQYSVA